MYSLLSDDGIRSNIRRYLLVVEADGVFVWVFGGGNVAVIVMTIEKIRRSTNCRHARLLGWRVKRHF